MAATQAQNAYYQAISQNQSDQLAFQQAQNAFTDAVSLGNQYGYSTGTYGPTPGAVAASAPPAGTPTLQAGQLTGSIGYVPGYTGVDAGQTQALLAQQAQTAQAAAGLTGFYTAPAQSQYTPGTFLQIDPSTYDASQFGGTQLDYVTSSGQLQRVTLPQAQAMGYKGTPAATIPFNTAATLEAAPPTKLPQQTLQAQQAYAQMNTQAQQNALNVANATGMYAAPSAIRAPGTNAQGQSFQNLDQGTQMAYYYSNGGDWTAAMNKWVADSNATIAQANGGQLPGQVATPTETLQAQNQYFNQAQQLAQMYGNYYAPGAPGQTAQAGVNGPQAGQQTLAAQQQAFTQNLQTQQFQQQAAQQYLSLLSQLQGPADYGAYLRTLGATPSGIQGLVGAAAGQYVPGGGTSGQAPQAQSLQNLVGAATGYGQAGAGYGPQGAPAQQSAAQTAQNQTYQNLLNAYNGQAGTGWGTNAATTTPARGGTASPGGMNYQDFLAQAQGLPPPSQIAPQSFNAMMPSQQQMLGSMYSSLGWAPGDINKLYQSSLPKYAAGSSAGSFKLV